MYLKVFAVAVLVLNGLVLSRQSPLMVNYSSNLLRYAKTAQIKAYMNEEQNPCDNFYELACGTWPQLHPASGKKQRTTYLEQLQDLFERKSINMLESDRNTDNSVDIILKDFYHSCVYRQSLQKVQLDPLFKITNFVGGWPKVFSNLWYEAEYDWLRVVAELKRKLGVDILIGLEIIPDFMDKNIQRIKVGAPKLDLYGKDKYARNEYRHFVAKKLRTYVPEMSAYWAQEVADQVISIEQKLLKDFPNNPSLTLQQITRLRYAADLKAQYGNYVDITRYFNIIFNDTIYQQIYESPEYYMANLVDVIRTTPKLNIANYTMWRVLQHFDAESEVAERYNNNYWCVLKILHYFPNQLESMFHRNYNNMNTINELQSVWADIKRGFREQLQGSSKLNWIKADTRQNAEQKLNNMELEILTYDDNIFLQQMQHLFIHKDRYYDNLINTMQWSAQQELAKLFEQPQQPKESFQLPKYKLTTNKIQIPVTFLQSRFFWDSEYPTALKYSSLGFLLAHEMIHGFDNVGRKFDKHGYQRSWWDSESEYAYDERTGCFAEQYRNYKFHGKELFDPQALITSIADSGGLALAHRAYKKWYDNVVYEQTKSKETLYALDFNHNQLFFIGFAQLHCADYDKSLTSINQLPEQLRVNDALANYNEFSKEFKCPPDSKLNPSKKCKIY